MRKQVFFIVFQIIYANFTTRPLCADWMISYQSTLYGRGGESNRETCPTLLKPGDQGQQQNYKSCWQYVPSIPRDKNGTLFLSSFFPKPISSVKLWEKYQINSSTGTSYKTLHQYSQSHQKQESVKNCHGYEDDNTQQLNRTWQVN